MLFIINGPSGSGKTTLGEFFKSKGLPELVSTTTRKPREGEAEGVSYYFVSEEEFDSLDLIESSFYSGNRYGLSKHEVNKKLEKGSAFATLDINGVKAMKKLYGDMVRVISIRVSRRKMKSRMLRRGDSMDKIRERLRYHRDSQEDQNSRLADYIIWNDRKIGYLFRQGREILESEGYCFDVEK